MARKTPPARPAAASTAEGGTVRLAYLSGPPEIHFAGRRWQRGVAQPVPASELAEMSARRDFAAHGFAEAAA